MPEFAAPNVKNISVGAGYIEIKPEGASVYQHVGNVPTFEFRLVSETLDHYAPINGMRVKDYSWTVELAAEIEITMEEITAKNLKLMMLGDISVVDGHTQVSIAARNSPSCALRYTATNETGPRWSIDLLSVMFNDENEYNPLTGDDFNTIVVSGSALAVDGTFGVMTLI